MRVALNALLRRARPDRLLIEPTGLGHPNEVLGVLTGDQYREVLSIHKTVTLVDARHLASDRYTRLETYNQQIAMADVIIGNKADLYGEGDREALHAYASKHGAPHAEVLITEQGALDPAWLRGATRFAGAADDHHHHDHHHHHHEDPQEPSLSDMPLPEAGVVKAENEGEGFQSVGWRFAPQMVFDRQKLALFLGELDAERMKGVFLTDGGVVAYNFAAQALTETVLAELSREPDRNPRTRDRHHLGKPVDVVHGREALISRPGRRPGSAPATVRPAAPSSSCAARMCSTWSRSMLADGEVTRRPHDPDRCR